MSDLKSTFNQDVSLFNFEAINVNLGKTNTKLCLECDFL